MAANFSIGIREGLEQQTILLFQSLLKSSGGKVYYRQHDFGINSLYIPRLIGTMLKTDLDKKLERACFGNLSHVKETLSIYVETASF